MKKILILLTALTLLCTACSGKKDSSQKGALPDSATESTASPAPASASNTDIPAAQTANPTPTVAPQEDNTPISKMYIDIIKSNDYFMKAKVSGTSEVNEFSVSVSAASTAMETLTNGALYNTIIKDGITYMIDHQSKLVITSGAEVANSASNMAGNKLVADGISFVATKTGNFDGKDCKFDEYTIPSGGTMRFYFSGNALVGIESTDGNETTKYIIEELSAGHRAAMHEIPSGYQILDMASLGG